MRTKENNVNIGTEVYDCTLEEKKMMKKMKTKKNLKYS